MKTISDFKRLMIPGSYWHVIHKYPDGKEIETSIRECLLSNTVNFSLRDNTSLEKQSYLSWPKKKDFVYISDNTIEIVHPGVWIILSYINHKENMSTT